MHQRFSLNGDHPMGHSSYSTHGCFFFYSIPGYADLPPAVVHSHTPGQPRPYRLPHAEGSGVYIQKVTGNDFLLPNCVDEGR